MTPATLRTFHFAGSRLLNGSPLPRKGAELPERRAALCASGWHGSVRVVDALLYAPGLNLCIRTLRGTIDRGRDKACASLATQTTDYVNVRPLLVEFAQWCAKRAKRHAAVAAAADAAAANADARAAATAAGAAADAASGVLAISYVARAAADAVYAASAAYVGDAADAIAAVEQQVQEDWLRPRALTLLGLTEGVLS